MSCFDGASPTWGPALAPQFNDSSPATVYTEAYVDSLPAQLIAFGYTCEQAKEAIYNDLMAISSTGSFGIIRNGETIPAAQADFVIPVDPTDAWCINSVTDGSFDGITSYVPTDVPPFQNPWHATTAGVDFFQNRQFFLGFCSVRAIIQIPIAQMLTAFDFDAWWACASGCVARPASRTGMQTFSNFTWPVANSLGKVNKV